MRDMKKDLNITKPVSIVNRKSHYPSKNDKKDRIVFFRERRRKMLLGARKSGSDGTFHPF